MREIFVDTAGWGNLVDPGQPFHRLATEIYREAREQDATLLTSNYVIAEVVALLMSPLQVPRKKLVAFVDSLKARITLKSSMWIESSMGERGACSGNGRTRAGASSTVRALCS